MTKPCTCMKRQAVAKAVSWEISPWWWTVIREKKKKKSESVSVDAEQVGPALALSLNAILHPPTATVHTDTTSSSTQDGRTDGRREERKDPGRKRGQKGGMKLASSNRRRGSEWRQRRRGGDNRREAKRRERFGRGRGAPVLSGAVCFLSVCLFSHSRNQFAIRTVTVEQREKEACQVGHTQREMERDKTSTRRLGGVLEKCRRSQVIKKEKKKICFASPAATTPNTHRP